jgi:apolipoprotein N-acyltransferase
LRSLALPLMSFTAIVLALGVLPRLLPPAGSSPNHAPMTVDLLQGNISQGEKFNFDTGVPQALAWYKQALLQSQADLVITPETAIPALPLDLPAGYWLGLQQHFAQAERAALVGLPLGNEEDGYTNSVVGLKPSSSATHYAYFKQHLVPFGEFIPPLFRWFTDLLNIPLGDFARGDAVQPSFSWKGERFAPNICYEDLFGEELAARFTPAQTAPTVLVNVSNLAWFGTGAVLDQHRHIARMRSLELDRPSLRATNTGVTALINRHGQVLAELPRATKGVLRVQLGGNDGQTFFAAWAGKYGQLPLWAVAFVVIGVALLQRQRD